MAQMPATGRLSAILARSGLDSLADLFAENDIDDDVIDELTEDDLRELGLSLGQRKKFLKAVERDQVRSPPPAQQAKADAARPENYEALKVRRMTIMFCDLVGSTDLARRLAPDELYEILQSYYATVSEVTRRFGGFVATLQGDGIVVLFGYPRTSSANAQRAVGAGLELIDAIAALRHRTSDGAEVNLSARIGIATGSTVVGRTHEGFLTEEIHTVGPIPNLAARLQSTAETGWVLVDDATRALAEDGFDFEILPRTRLKGFADPVPRARALEPRREAPEAVAFPAALPMVGREAEQQYLADCWRLAKNGTPRLIHVWGGAGLGKSRLVAEVEGQVAADNGRILRLNCAPVLSQSPLAPVLARLEGFVGHASDSAPSARMSALNHLFREQSRDDVDRIADLLGIPGERRFSQGETAAARRTGLLEALTRWLLSGSDRPTLIVVENIQWADPTSLELLNRCRDALHKRRVLMLATSRAAERQVWVVERDVEAFELDPLTRDETETLLDRHLNGRVLPDEVREAIVLRSDGNPMVLLELLEAAQRSGGDEIAFDWQVPPSLYDSIAERIDGLQQGRAIASAASAFGRQAPAHLLAAVLDMDSEALGEGAAHLRDIGLFEPRKVGISDTLVFRHAHVRDVLYEGLTAAKRRELHAKIAECMGQRDPAMAGQRPELLAWHAFEGQDFATAAPLLLQTGERAAERSALTEATHHLTQALNAIEALPRDAGTKEQELQALTALTAVKRARLGIAVPEVGDLSLRVYELAVELGNGRAELVALNGLYAYHLVSADFRGARLWGDRLLSAAQRTGDETFEMIGLRAAGAVALHEGTLDRALDLLTEARGRYEIDRHKHLAYVHGYDHYEVCSAFLGYTHWMKGDPAAAWRACDEAVSHSEAIDHPHSLAQALVFQGMLAMLARRLDLSAAAGARAINISERYALRFMAAPARFYVEAAEILSSPRSNHTCDDLLTLHDDIGSFSPDNYAPMVRSTATACLLKTGQPERARAFLNEAFAVQNRTGEFWTLPELLRLDAMVTAAEGDAAAAAAARKVALAEAQERGAIMLALRIACDMVEADEAGADTVSAALGALQSRDEGWDVQRALQIVQG